MNTRKTFIYRLFDHSRTAFAIVVCFLVIYAFFFLKKMDMTIFAYNSMFVSEISGKHTDAYALKINDKLLPISEKLWWKKDFLESSLIGFSVFLENEKKTYLQQYIVNKISDSTQKQYLLDRLTSYMVDPILFISNYARQAGYPLQTRDKLEIVKYRIQYSKNKVKKLDSTTIFIKRSRL